MDQKADRREIVDSKEEKPSQQTKFDQKLARMQARRAQKAEEKVKRCEAIGRAATDLAERRHRNRKRNGLKAALTAEYEARKSFSRQDCKELADKYGLSVA